jgi:Phytanoyl-CoA dioxygenase (PhyH)
MREQLAIQGWAKLDHGTAVQDVPCTIIPPEQVRTGWWAPASDEQVIAGAELEILAAADTEIEIVPCSQGLDFRGLSPGPVDQIPMRQGERVRLDSRLWMRLSDPAAVRLSSYQAARKEPFSLEDTELRDFMVQGYRFFRRAIAPGLVDDLKEALSQAHRQDVADWGEDVLKRLGQLGAIRNLPDLGAPFLDLLDHATLVAFISRLLRPGYILQTFDGLILSPGEGRFPWDFHTDLDALKGVEFPRDRIAAVNVLYYLGETTTANGATWIVPHSHLSLEPSPSSELLSELAIPAEGQPGDILVFDSRLWHCAGNNLSSEPRSLIKTLFCEPWIRPEMDYRRAMSPLAWGALPPRVKDLLGGSAAPATTVAEYRARYAPKSPSANHAPR